MEMLSALTGHDQMAVLVEDEAMVAAFANFLYVDVANGDARPDTIRTYKTHVTQWVNWCKENLIDARQATQQDVKNYRQYLISNGMKHNTIALKLTTIRRFYAAAINNGYIRINPADNVNPPLGIVRLCKIV
jgi:site-specific recombinase XerD